MKEAAVPKVLLWGAKSKAHIINEMLVERGSGPAEIIFDAHVKRPEFEFAGRFVSEIEELKQVLDSVTHFVVCIGGEHGYTRFKTAEYLQRVGLQSLSVAHERSYVDPTATVGNGCQFMPFAVLHKFSEVGEQSILNTNATVDHDCIIGRGVHVMGSAAIAGNVEVGDFAAIGTNATVLPFIKIGEGAIVGAGAVVREDVEPYTVVAGVPARPLRRHQPVCDEELLKGLLR